MLGEPASWGCCSCAPCCVGFLKPWLWWFWATCAVIRWDLGAQGVQLVGFVLVGLPHPVIPNMGFSEYPHDALPVAVGVALVSYIDTTITGRAFAMRGGYRLDPNQELIALRVRRT